MHHMVVEARCGKCNLIIASLGFYDVGGKKYLYWSPCFQMKLSREAAQESIAPIPWKALVCNAAWDRAACLKIVEKFWAKDRTDCKDIKKIKMLD